MISGDVLAKTCDTWTAGDKPHQRCVVRTGRIAIDHGLAVDNLQQSGVVYLSPRSVPDEERAKSKFRRDIAAPSTSHSPRSRHGQRSKTGEPVSIAPRPSRRHHPADRGNRVTRHGTQLRGHDRQRTPTPSPSTDSHTGVRSRRMGCDAGCRSPAGRGQSVADEEWPVSGEAELGEFGVDTGLDGAEEADVLAVHRRDVRQHRICSTRISCPSGHEPAAPDQRAIDKLDGPTADRRQNRSQRPIPRECQSALGVRGPTRLRTDWSRTRTHRARVETANVRVRQDRHSIAVWIAYRRAFDDAKTGRRVGVVDGVHMLHCPDARELGQVSGIGRAFWDTTSVRGVRSILERCLDDSLDEPQSVVTGVTFADTCLQGSVGDRGATSSPTRGRAKSSTAPFRRRALWVGGGRAQPRDDRGEAWQETVAGQGSVLRLLRGLDPDAVLDEVWVGQGVSLHDGFDAAPSQASCRGSRRDLLGT